MQSADRKTNTATVDLSNAINKLTVKRIAA